MTDPAALLRKYETLDRQRQRAQRNGRVPKSPEDFQRDGWELECGWSDDGTEREGGSGPSLAVRCAKDIEPRSIQWLWKRRLARSRYGELVGFPGIGKTALVMDVIARLTTDGRWPDGTSGPTTEVLIVAAEDEAEDVLVPRLITAGADLARVRFVERSWTSQG